MINNLPNFLTLLRVILAPIFFFLVISDNPVAVQFGVGLFIIGAVTDYYDGYFARRLKISSSLGTFLDPLADKVLITAAFFAFVYIGVLELWMVIIVIARDLLMTLLRLYANNIKQPIVTSRSAKAKTLLQMLFVAYLLTLFTAQNMPQFPELVSFATWLVNSVSTYILMLALTGYTLWTMVEYSFKNKPLMARLFVYRTVKN
ncbi:MAG: CDP-diacylglycerol--glycerol-3-phosphate 3-phosphatidyltransferase [Bacteroidota bacterium]